MRLSDVDFIPGKIVDEIVSRRRKVYWMKDKTEITFKELIVLQQGISPDDKEDNQYSVLSKEAKTLRKHINRKIKELTELKKMILRY